MDTLNLYRLDYNNFTQEFETSKSKVNVKDYVNAGISNGTMVPREAYKFTRIIARPGVPNETIISWSVNQEGNEIQEKI